MNITIKNYIDQFNLLPLASPPTRTVLIVSAVAFAILSVASFYVFCAIKRRYTNKLPNNENKTLKIENKKNNTSLTIQYKENKNNSQETKTEPKKEEVKEVKKEEIKLDIKEINKEETKLEDNKQNVNLINLNENKSIKLDQEKSFSFPKSYYIECWNFWDKVFTSEENIKKVIEENGKDKFWTEFSNWIDAHYYYNSFDSLPDSINWSYLINYADECAFLLGDFFSNKKISKNIYKNLIDHRCNDDLYKSGMTNRIQKHPFRQIFDILIANEQIIMKKVIRKMIENKEQYGTTPMISFLEVLTREKTDRSFDPENQHWTTKNFYIPELASLQPNLWIYIAADPELLSSLIESKDAADILINNLKLYFSAEQTVEFFELVRKSKNEKTANIIHEAATYKKFHDALLSLLEKMSGDELEESLTFYSPVIKHDNEKIIALKKTAVKTSKEISNNLDVKEENKETKLEVKEEKVKLSLLEVKDEVKQEENVETKIDVKEEKVKLSFTIDDIIKVIEKNGTDKFWTEFSKWHIANYYSPSTNDIDWTYLSTNYPIKCAISLCNFFSDKKISEHAFSALIFHRGVEDPSESEISKKTGKHPARKILDTLLANDLNILKHVIRIMIENKNRYGTAPVISFLKVLTEKKTDFRFNKESNCSELIKGPIAELTSLQANLWIYIAADQKLLSSLLESNEAVDILINDIEYHFSPKQIVEFFELVRKSKDKETSTTIFKAFKDTEFTHRLLPLLEKMSGDELKEALAFYSPIIKHDNEKIIALKKAARKKPLEEVKN